MEKEKILLSFNIQTSNFTMNPCDFGNVNLKNCKWSGEINYKPITIIEYLKKDEIIKYCIPRIENIENISAISFFKITDALTAEEFYINPMHIYKISNDFSIVSTTLFLFSKSSNLTSNVRDYILNYIVKDGVKVDLMVLNPTD